jgi:putative endonuclease
VEETNNIWAALSREKELKSWTRAKKIGLIRENNPKWEDLGIAIVGDATEIG